jgi:hypothetical protein
VADDPADIGGAKENLARLDAIKVLIDHLRATR